MECPHCGAESLMGATTCVACGESMFGRPRGPSSDSYGHADPEGDPAQAPAPLPPPFAATDDAPPGPTPPPLESRPKQRHTLCKICMGPCDDPLTQMCDTCQMRSAMSGEPAAPEVAFGRKLGTAAFRPPPVRRGPTAVQRAVRAILWGVLLVGAGLGVVTYVRPPEAGAKLVHDVRSEAVTVEFAMPRDAVLRYQTRLDLNVKREEVPSAFDDTMMTVFDLRQVATHDHEVMLDSGDDTAAVLEVRTECKLESQSGVWEQKDGSHVSTYPWPGRLETLRVRVRPDGAARTMDGGEPWPARDVPPFLSFGDTAGPQGDLTVGTSWKTEALLPCLADAKGALAPTPFECELTYAGRRVIEGRACAIVRLEARPRRSLDARFESLDGARGRVAGALAFDTQSGLLERADLEVDVSAQHGSPDADLRVSVKGALTVTRR